MAKLASCNVCGQSLCYKSTSANLRKHIDRRHPTVDLSAYSYVGGAHNVQSLVTTTAALISKYKVSRK